MQTNEDTGGSEWLFNFPRLRTVTSLFFLFITFGAKAAEPVVSNGAFSDFDSLNRPLGWEIQSDGHNVAVIDGALRISPGELPEFTFVKQDLPGQLLHESALQFSGRIRTESVGISATLVVRVSGQGQQLFLDDMRGRVVVGDTEWTFYTIQIPAIPDAETLEVGVLLIGGGTAWFDDLTLDQIEGTGEAGEALKYVKNAAELLRENYLHTASVDWDSLMFTSTSSLRDDATLQEAHSTLTSLVTRLGDPHITFLKPPADDSSDSKKMLYSQLTVSSAGKIAYAVVQKWSAAADSPASTALISKAHADLQAVSDSTCGWIIDLTENSGGNMWPMLASLGPIIGEGDLGAFSDPKEPDQSTIWWYEAGIAGTRTAGAREERTQRPDEIMPVVSLTVPVAIIVGPNTASAGEAIAIALMGRQSSRTFGQRTAAWATANIALPLSDGATIVMPAGYLTSRRGGIFPHGIIPDISAVSSDDAKSLAKKWMLDQPSCAL